MTVSGTTSLLISEMREFASFKPCTQRFIRRSLDVGLGRSDAFRLWARDAAESAAIRRQYIAYQPLKKVRGTVPDPCETAVPTAFLGTLVGIAAGDLAEERIDGFPPFRFLYERLLGAEVRPWLPSIFCAAAALPQIDPQQRKRLLQSLSEAAATAPAWSIAQPGFYPEFIEDAAA